MNRRERRIAEKRGRNEEAGGAADRQPVQSPSVPVMPVVGDPGKPGLLLRMISRALLSQFVLDRVHQPHVLGMLSDVARQSGRMDALIRIQAKLLASERG